MSSSDQDSRISRREFARQSVFTAGAITFLAKGLSLGKPGPTATPTGSGTGYVTTDTPGGFYGAPIDDNYSKRGLGGFRSVFDTEYTVELEAWTTPADGKSYNTVTVEFGGSFWPHLPTPTGQTPAPLTKTLRNTASSTYIPLLSLISLSAPNSTPFHVAASEDPASYNVFNCPAIITSAIPAPVIPGTSIPAWVKCTVYSQIDMYVTASLPIPAAGNQSSFLIPIEVEIRNYFSADFFGPDGSKIYSSLGNLTWDPIKFDTSISFMAV